MKAFSGAGIAVVLACGVGLWAQTPPAYSRRTPVVEAVERARPAVVNLRTTSVVRQTYQWPFDHFVFERKVPTLGTGCIVSRLGYVVTNWHVVRDVESIQVTLVDGTSYSAHLVVRDPDVDLAILKIDTDKPLPELTLGSSSDLMIGETVIAVGNPFEYGHTVTTGVVSALNRSIQVDNELIYSNLIQTDASINPGNSGGPLLNINGEMIGICTAIRSGAEGIGFAIPVDTVKQSLSRLLSIRRLRHTWHGAVIRELKAEELAQGHGAAIVRVEPGSPAAAAGLKAGDVVVSVAGQPVRNTIDFEAALLDTPAGQAVSVTFLRDRQRHTVSLTLQPAPIPAVVMDAWRRLGMEVEPISPARIAHLPREWTGGLHVLRVLERGPAHAAGLRAGDILVGLAGFRVTSLSDLDYILKQFDQPVRVRVYLVRNGRTYDTRLVVLPPAGQQ